MFVYAKLPLEGPRKLVETGCLVTGNWDRVECVRKTSFFTVHPRCLCSLCIRFLLKINSKNIHLFSWWYQAEKGSLTALTSVFLCLATHLSSCRLLATTVKFFFFLSIHDVHQFSNKEFFCFVQGKTQCEEALLLLKTIFLTFVNSLLVVIWFCQKQPCDQVKLVILRRCHFEWYF